jgi:hypothetical protein
VTVQSRLNRGSTFTVTLPLLSEPATTLHPDDGSVREPHDIRA